MLLVVLACKKIEQPEMDATQDPCDCLEQQRTTFSMGEKFGPEFIDLDTIYKPMNYGDGNPANFYPQTYAYVYFSANYKDAISYEWQVGQNPTTQTTADFGLYFTQLVDNLPVRLIIKSKPNKKCFPNDDGIDTIYRYLTIQCPILPPIVGKYEGSLQSNPNEKFVIEFDTLTRYYSLWNSNVCGIVCKNLPNGKIKPLTVGSDLGGGSYSFFLGEFEGDIPHDDDIIYVKDDIGGWINGYFHERSRGIYDRKTKEIKIWFFTKEVINATTLSQDVTAEIFIGKRIQ